MFDMFDTPSVYLKQLTPGDDPSKDRVARTAERSWGESHYDCCMAYMNNPNYITICAIAKEGSLPKVKKREAAEDADYDLDDYYCREDERKERYEKEEQNRVVGGIIYSLNHGYIPHLLVERKWRDNGVGKMLIRQCQNGAKSAARDANEADKAQASCLSVTTEEENDRARHVYESMGFSEKQVIEDYYYNDGGYDPAVVYEWSVRN